MSIVHLFPTPVWKFSLSKHDIYKRRLVRNLEHDFKTRPNLKASWAGLCNTWQCHMDDVSVPLNDLYDEIMAEVMKFIQHLGVGKSSYYKIVNSWFNVHTHDMYQEVHEHLPSFISGNYYLQFDPKKDKSLVFVNENKSFFYSSWAMDLPIMNPELMGKFQIPDIKEGDVLLFPATLNHFVPKSDPHDQLRITNSFNILPVASPHLILPNNK